MYIIVYTNSWGEQREYKAYTRSSLIRNANIVIKSSKSNSNWSIVEIKKDYLTLDEVLWYKIQSPRLWVNDI